MMNRSNVLASLATSVAVIGLAIVAVPHAALADTRVVNCAGGRRLESALHLPAGRQLTLVVQGTCHEHVTIRRDDVTLQGDPVAGGTIHGSDPTRSTILIDGGKRVVIDRLTVTGGLNGVTGTNGAVFTVQSSTVQNAAYSGVVAMSGSTVTVAGSQLLNNGGTSTTQDRSGLAVTDNSSGVIVNSTVSGNGDAGIAAEGSSSVRIGLTLRNEPGPNTIRNNGSGIALRRSSAGLIEGNTIENNPASGIAVANGAAATITRNTIQSNGYGIAVSSAGARIGLTERIEPAGNTIRSNTLDGILVLGGSNAYMRRT